jgi:RNA-directed DNA polymerase
MQDRIGWIIDADGSACFASLDHDLGCEGLPPRVTAGAIRRLIRTWLRAGVLAGATLSDPERGSPPGGVRSPRRAKLVLEHVLDAWCEQDVTPRMQGRWVPLRWADACVIGGEREDEAHRMLAVRPKRLARFTRTMHPPKPCRVRCQPPRGPDAGERGDGPVTLLRLSHSWAKARRGSWVLKRRPAQKRVWRALRAVWPWCRAPRHDPIRGPYRALCPKLRGHDQSDGLRGTSRKLAALSRRVERAWREWLSRRGGPRPSRWETCATLRAVLPWPTPCIRHTI